MVSSTGSFYDEDLAYVHHVAFGDFAEQTGAALLGILAERGLQDGRVYDLGCGDGRLARRLVAAGYDVVGADLSRAMIQLARQAVPEGEFRVRSLWDLDLEPCRVVTILGEGLGYAAAGEPSHTRLEGFFQRVYDRLLPGGLLAFDLIVTSPEDPMRYRTWRAGEDWASLTAVDEEPDLHRLTRTMTVFRQVDGSYRRSEEKHDVRVMEEGALVELLEQVGFEVQVGDHYGDFALAPRRRAFLAARS